MATCKDCIWLKTKFRTEETCAARGIKEDADTCKEFLANDAQLAYLVEALNGCRLETLQQAKTLLPHFVTAAKVEGYPQPNVGDEVTWKEGDKELRGRVVRTTTHSCSAMDMESGEVSSTPLANIRIVGRAKTNEEGDKE